jgi:predicted Rossmann fold nucleotide-binding protein DprA/Smf involved in DNA uptake
MPSTSQVIAEARKLVENRLADLDGERRRLERALAELGGKARQRGPGRPRGPAATVSPTRRRHPGNRRGEQAVQLISKSPGVGAQDIAKTMKIKPNYLYRVLGQLEKEGRVKKDGRKYYPAG